MCNLFTIQNKKQIHRCKHFKKKQCNYNPFLMGFDSFSFKYYYIPLKNINRKHLLLFFIMLVVRGWTEPQESQQPHLGGMQEEYILKGV